jgi:hypothetical protein
MSSRSLGRPRWTTSCFDDALRESAHEFRTLGRHLQSCRAVQGRLFGLRCAAEALDGFLASRFVTTVALATLFVVLGSLWV